MSTKVSEKVWGELSGNTTEIHTSVLSLVLEQVLTAGTGGLVSELAANVPFTDILSEVSSELKK